MTNPSGCDSEVLKRLSDAGFTQEFDPLNNGLFINPKEKRAAAASIRSAPVEDVKDFIRDNTVILWNIPSASERAVLRRLGRL
jgi:hypothetical protein